MNVVSYCRLSKDDNRTRYSSIEAQKQLALDYAQKKNWKIQKFYEDDDVTGFVENERRPAFYEMLQDIECGKIDVVIVKDLSRFGRKNSLTLTNIDYFKELGINLILTKDSMLSGEFNLQEDDDSMLGLSTWFNEKYVKELSAKVKIGMHHQQKNGTLLQGPKFGYLKTKIKGELIVDETVRETITTIYNLYEQGYGDRKICFELNDNYHFLTPSQIVERDLREKGKTYAKPVKKIWDEHMVKRILNDEIYTGTLFTHKAELTGIHQKATRLDRDKQYQFEKHHEAIISKEQFDRVQEIRKTRKESSAFYTKKTRSYIFGGFLRCGECNGGVVGITRIRSKRPGYVPKPIYDCNDYRKYGNSRCVSHNIREEYILANFKQFLITLKAEYKQELKAMNIETQKQNKKDRISILKKNLEKTQAEYKVLLSQKITELARADAENKDIIENTYKDLAEEKISLINSLKNQIAFAENQTLEQTKTKIKTAIEYFTEIIESEKPSKAILSMVLNKIYIYHDKSIRIDLKVDIKNLINRGDCIEIAS